MQLFSSICSQTPLCTFIAIALLELRTTGQSCYFLFKKMCYKGVFFFTKQCVKF